MRLHIAAALALLALLAGAPAGRAVAQEERPRSGKIDEVEEDADGESDTWGVFEFVYHAGRFVAHLVPWVTSRQTGQGYLRYPYEDARVVEHFVLRDVRRDRGFNALSIAHFDDAGSTLRGLHLEYAGAYDVVGVSAEFDAFREPLADETDRLYLGRLGLQALSRLGHPAFLRTGVALRAMVLDDGRAALGPEGEIGVQVFPLRPLALDGTFRFAGLTGAGASWFGTGLLDASVGAGLMVGRVEARGGLRWVAVGRATTFSGPTFGARVWF